MAQAHVPFDKRLKRIVRRHERMSNGVVRTVNSDGLIVARPRMYRPRFPLKGIVLLVVVGFLFKGFLFSSLGPQAYAERIALLKSGTMIEQVGAWAMHPDVATVFISEQLNLILR